jgi:hypothetical protein
MSAKVAIAVEASNPGGAVLGIENPETGTIQKSINNVLRAKFGKKAWAYLAVLIRLQQRGISDRVAKHRIAGTRPYDLVDIALLLGSELGDQIESAILGAIDARPAWFKQRERNAKRAKILQDIEQLQLELRADEQRDAREAASLRGRAAR